jgi:hypothetical protein
MAMPSSVFGDAARGGGQGSQTRRHPARPLDHQLVFVACAAHEQDIADNPKKTAPTTASATSRGPRDTDAAHQDGGNCIKIQVDPVGQAALGGADAIRQPASAAELAASP